MSNININNLRNLDKNHLIEMIFIQTKTIEQLTDRITELENQLRKDSSNSSKPPSTDNFSKKNQSLRQPSNKRSGGQKGHQGKTRKQSEPDEIISCRPEKCSHCGKDLEGMDSEITARRQEIDIPPIKPIITEYQREEIKCSCGHCNKGQFPDHLQSRFQLGQNIKSFIIYLSIAHHLPYQRLTQIIDDLLNIKISEGTIDKTIDCFHERGRPLYNQILTEIKKQRWTGSDETGARVEKKTWWQWVWQNKRGSFYAIEPGRGYAVVEKYFGTDYLGVLVHDCWSAQNNTVAGGHQLCHPHLLRDLNFIIEAEKSRWAYEMKQLLLSSEKARDIIWNDGFNSLLRKRIILEYQDKLERLAKQFVSGKESKRLQKRFRKHQEKIFYFMNDPDIPWHNNSSEQAIRNAKLHQKISGCFRSIKGAKRRAVILSIIETCKKRNLNVLDSLQGIFRGDFSFEVGE